MGLKYIFRNKTKPPKKKKPKKKRMVTSLFRTKKEFSFMNIWNPIKINVDIKARQRVGWCFEPSQPRRIILGLKTNFSASLSYCTLKSFHVNHKISTEI